MRVVEKAFAYITSLDKLLVFDHVEFPDAGVQVPAGTIRPEETPARAATREAREETGLDQFLRIDFLGNANFDARPYGRDEIHRRHFFHLPLRGDAPQRWRHREQDPSVGDSEAIELELYWLPLSEAAICLAHGHAALLDTLRGRCPTVVPGEPRLRVPHEVFIFSGCRYSRGHLNSTVRRLIPATKGIA